MQSSLRHGQPRFCTEISMIAGGTGLTPCYQVLAAILRDPEDTTKVQRPLVAAYSPEWPTSLAFNGTRNGVGSLLFG